jgi:hypothetical protein
MHDHADVVTNHLQSDLEQIPVSIAYTDRDVPGERALEIAEKVTVERGRREWLWTPAAKQRRDVAGLEDEQLCLTNGHHTQQ